MSSPARSWSETTIACASLNCSRYHGSIIAVSSGRPHMFCVYQRGRGQEPVTVAGSIRSFVAVNAIWSQPPLARASLGGRSYCPSRPSPPLRILLAPPRAHELDDLERIPVGILCVDA